MRNEMKEKRDEDITKKLEISSSSSYSSKMSTSDSSSSTSSLLSEKEDDDALSASSTEEEEMPLLKYGRLHPLSLKEKPHTQCVCSAMGHGICSPSTLAPSSGGYVGGILSGASNAASSLPSLADYTPSEVTFLVLALGYEDGCIDLLDLQTGKTLISSGKGGEGAYLRIALSWNEKSGIGISGLSFDSSGKYLCGCRENGDVGIWELSYRYLEGGQTRVLSDSVPLSSPPVVFRNPGLVPTSLAVDPGYGAGSSFLGTAISNAASAAVLSTQSAGATSGFTTNLHKSSGGGVAMGCSNGRLMVMKKGFLGRRNDTVVVQSGEAVRCVVWRAQFLAWADESYVIVYSTESNTTLARINRPTGAKLSLYPSVQSLSPHLVFETSSSLLIGWGDCIMNITINETTEFLPPVVTSPPTARRKYDIQRAMAWELDCVCCGIVPMDPDYVAVLGLVPTNHDEGDGDEASKYSTVLEMQLIHRGNGSIPTSDAMKLVSSATPSTTPHHDPTTPHPPSASQYKLLSSFALPRMDDSSEAAAVSGTTAYLSSINMLKKIMSDESQSGFRDAHLRWNVHTVIRHHNENRHDDSDYDNEHPLDYLFSNAQGEDAASNSIPAAPPIMIISSPHDTVLIRTRDVDDAISHATSRGKYALALRTAMSHKRMLRRHSLKDLVHEYFAYLLRPLLPLYLDKETSLQRCRMAAQLTPVLLGGDVEMWERYIVEFAKIAGGLFLLYEYLPVRDPKLASSLYEMVLDKMFVEVESLYSKDNASATTLSNNHRSCNQSRELYLNALRAWGTTYSLQTRIDYMKSFLEHHDTPNDNTFQRQPLLLIIQRMEHNLRYRWNQSSSGYLKDSSVPISLSGEGTWTQSRSNKALSIGTPSTDDPLYDIDNIILRQVPRTPLLLQFVENSMKNRAMSTNEEVNLILYMTNHRDERLTAGAVATEALAELYYMKGQYDKSLSLDLAIGAYFTAEAQKQRDLLDKEALGWVHCRPAAEEHHTAAREPKAYQHVLAMIEYHYLHRYLLVPNLIPPYIVPSTTSSTSEKHKPKTMKCSPMIALLQLIGLELAAHFFIKNSSLTSSNTSDTTPLLSSNTSDTTPLLSSNSTQEPQHNHDTHTPRLPINLVAEQLKTRPKLLHWYLHLIFLHRPEIYVQFSNTAVPPKSIMDLLRIHLELYVQLVDLEFYKGVGGLVGGSKKRMVEDSPLMTFLKATLPLGSIRSDEVRRLLEARRQGIPSPTLTQVNAEPHASDLSTPKPTMDIPYPHLFACELAHVIERSDAGNSLEDSKYVLRLYLEGACSLYLAVAYAERNKVYHEQLWKILISFCLNGGVSPEEETKDSTPPNDRDGSLFGALLETAAQCGADLSQLVSQIPTGMQIEGIRPKLVSAVQDYNLQLKMHEAASDILAHDKVALLREVTHRGRRGRRVDWSRGKRIGFLDK